MKEESQLQLFESTKDDFGIPLRAESQVVDHNGGASEVHALNDERVSSVLANLKPSLQFSNNPYFNKKELITKHALHLNPITLYKMGQIGEEKLIQGIIEKQLKPSPELKLSKEHTSSRSPKRKKSEKKLHTIDPNL